MKRIAAMLLLAAGVAVAVIGEADVDRRLARMEPALDAEIASRAFHVDPAELLELMHNPRVPLVIVDVRDEAHYNVFHLAESHRVDADDAGAGAIAALPAASVKIIVGAGEERAEEAWKRARALGAINTYLLAGGMDGWLELYADYAGHAGGSATPPVFTAALGARHDAAFPAAGWFAGREFERKVKVIAADAGPTGGCGG